MKKLKELRQNIDKIDLGITELLRKRLELALMSKRLKKDITDTEREKQVLKNVKEKVKILGLLDETFIDGVFKLNIKESKRLQKKDSILFGFSGDYGSYEELAAMGLEKKSFTVSFDNYDELTAALKEGLIDLAVVATENSYLGSVSEVSDLLLKTDLKIVSEIRLDLKYPLLSLPGTKYEEIREVYLDLPTSIHCKDFLNSSKITPILCLDAAKAARLISERGTSVIASQRCAKLYGLEVVKSNLGNNKNFKRFLILARKEKIPPLNEKRVSTSLIFSLPDRPGALCESIRPFSDLGINLKRIESIMTQDDYYFLMDISGNIADKKVKNALSLFKKKVKTYKFLGSYSDLTKRS